MTLTRPRRAWKGRIAIQSPTMAPIGLGGVCRRQQALLAASPGPARQLRATAIPPTTTDLMTTRRVLVEPEEAPRYRAQPKWLGRNAQSGNCDGEPAQPLPRCTGDIKSPQACRYASTSGFPPYSRSIWFRAASLFHQSTAARPMSIIACYKFPFAFLFSGRFTHTPQRVKTNPQPVIICLSLPAQKARRFRLSMTSSAFDTPSSSHADAQCCAV
jgi:hypothetical protein